MGFFGNGWAVVPAGALVVIAVIAIAMVSRG